MPGLRQIDVYETRQALYVTGYDVVHGGYRVLEILRPALGGGGATMSLLPLNLVQAADVYTRQQLDEHLKSRQVALGTKLVSGGYCLYGFVRIIESYYLIVVSSASPMASLHGHDIYTIKDTMSIPVTYKPRKTMEESRYKAMLTSTDLTNGFYFSYTYDLTSSLQRNHKLDASEADKSAPVLMMPQDMFIWNLHPLKPLLRLANAPPNAWVVPIVFGFLEQKTVRLEDGHLLKYTLIARRSRCFAGTRYLRRGVDNQGFVANEVETEQIVTIESGLYKLARSSSLVQIRGSIPLYWGHVNLLTPSPDIRIEKVDSDYAATRMHFNRLIDRYGAQVAVLNLVRQHHGGREVLLGKSFGVACASLNANVQPSDDGLEDKKKNSMSAIPLYAITQLVTVFGIISIGGGQKAAKSAGGEADVEADDDYLDDGEDEPEGIDLDIAAGSGGGDGSSSIPITYLAYDLLDAHELHEGLTVFDTLTKIGRAIYPRTGFFVQPPFGKTNFTSYPIDADHLKDDVSLSVLVQKPAVVGGSDDDTHSDQLENSSAWSKGGRGSGSSTSSSSNSSSSNRSGRIFNEGGPAPFSETQGPTIQPAEESLKEYIELRPLRASPLTVPPINEWQEQDGDEPISPQTSTATSSSAGSSSGGSSPRGGNDDDSDETEEIFEEYLGSDATAGPGLHCGIFQRGVLRTNCIDCLDRTNIGQFTYAKFVLPYQLKALGIYLSPAGLSDVLLLLMEAWARHGDEIAKQYGGSGAMHRVDIKGTDTAGETEFTMTGGISNGVVAINRYYSNISMDAEKQQAIDLMLGVFEPKRGAPASWEMDLGPASMRGELPSKPVVPAAEATDPPPAPITWQSVPGTGVDGKEGSTPAPPADRGRQSECADGGLKLECIKQTPFFSASHFDKHTMTSFKAIQACDHNAIHLDKVRFCIYLFFGVYLFLYLLHDFYY